MHLLPPFIEQGFKVFQMFRTLPDIKPHPVPGSLFPSNGKVVRSKMLPSLNKFKQHRDRYLVCVCVHVFVCLAKDFDQVMGQKGDVKWDPGD